MDYVIYIFGGLSIVTALGGLACYLRTHHLGVLLASLGSILCAAAAIGLTSVWPLVAAILLNYTLRLIRPDMRRRTAGLRA